MRSGVNISLPCKKNSAFDHQACGIVGTFAAGLQQWPFSYLMGKKIIRQTHLWLGLASGLVIFIVTLTGASMAFEEELEHLFSHKLYYVTPGTARLSIDSLKKQAASFDPAIKITRMEAIPHDPARTVIFLGKKKTETYMIVVNPYTGQVIKGMNYEKRFFRVMLGLHRYLLMKDTGKAITGVSCLIFLFLVLSGIILWWPKRWKYIKQRLTVKWEASFKRVVWDLHAVGGFYVHLVIFVIALTGLAWAYKWFNDGIYLMFDGKPPAGKAAPLNKQVHPAGEGVYELVYQAANKALPYKGELSMIFPANDSTSITVNKENYEAKIPNIIDVIYFENADGAVISKKLYDDQTLGLKVRRAMYTVHTGKVFGWPTKLLAMLSCIFAASLPVTGLMIWLKGDKKKVKKPLVKKVRNLQLQ